jgi:5-methylcytosine-specific restriction endonuclease McrA
VRTGGGRPSPTFFIRSDEMETAPPDNALPNRSFQYLVRFFKSLRLHKCFYCGRELDRETFSRDHMIPKSRGGVKRGLLTRQNLVDACKGCNGRKGSQTVEEFRKTVGATLFYGEQAVLNSGSVYVGPR